MNDSIKPTKVKQYLVNIHLQHKHKNKRFSKRTLNMLKKMKFNYITEPFYVVSLEIDK